MAAKRSLGQNFLVDRRIAARIIRALGPRPGEAILEIGPGRGALTLGLLRAAGRIAVVELDRDLADGLRRAHDPDRLLLLEQDVLDLDFAAVLRALDVPAGVRMVVAGNLPYNISKPIAQKLLRERDHVERAVLMFQREVAERLTATPGSRRYGPLGVLAGFAFEIEALFDVAPAAFAPRPRVVSTVTRWRAREPCGLSAREEKRLRAVLQAAFARRRRTLRNNLRTALGDDDAASALLERAGIDGNLRAEAVPPDAFTRLAENWEESALL